MALAYGEAAVEEFNRTLVASESAGELAAADDERQAEAEPHERMQDLRQERKH